MSNEVLELLEKTEGVLHGHFCLTSGLHSNIYFQCAKLYQYPDITEKIGKMLAEKLKGIEFDTLDKLCWALECTPNDILIYIPDQKTE